jgi:hypothetical protein
MREILKQISRKSIKSYIEKNLDDFYTLSSQHPNFISRMEDKINWVVSKKADWPECIFRVDFKGYKLDDEIEKIKKLILNGTAPNGWTVGPLTQPRDLGNKLERKGFKNVYQQTGMALELEKLDKRFILQNDLTVKKVKNEESLQHWCQVVSQTFGIKIDFELLKFLLPQKEVHFYLGYFNQNPVSALLLYLSSGVAGLHAVSTLSKYRNKGYGIKISGKALKYASIMGFRVGVLQASSLGEKIYKKLGFKKYCDIISYALDEK